MSKYKPILVFGCVHNPFALPGAMDFLRDTHKRFRCDPTVICAGDWFDFHAMSRHATEPDAMSPSAELALAQLCSAKMTKLFPKGVLVLGNHDMIPERRLTEMFLTPAILKSRNELFGLPRAWRVKPLFHVIRQYNVLVEHGVGNGGPNGAINAALAKRSSYAQAHTHQYGGCQYRENYKDKIFGLNVGTLADESTLALRYSKYAKWKGVKGCGVIHNGQEAQFVPYLYK